MCEPLLLRAARKEDSYDFNCVFEHVKEIFANSDCVIGNLETSLARIDAGLVNKLFSFNALDEFADAVKDAGIANDGTHPVPEEDHYPFITNIKGTNVAIILFTYATNYFNHYMKSG